MRNPHPWHDWKAGAEIRRLCEQLTPDVVHTHSSKAGIIGRKAAWRIKNSKLETRNLGGAKLPIVLHTIHGLPFHPYQNALVNTLWIALEKRAAQRCDGIICVADAMTRQARAPPASVPASPKISSPPSTALYGHPNLP